MPLDRRHFFHQAVLAGAAPLLRAHPGAAAEPAKVPPGWPESAFLEGNFFPVHAETTATDLKVIGALPKELDGLFVRNGPNPQFAPKGRYHWFDGDGMLHGVRVRDGGASYLNRYVRTAGFEKEKDAGKALFGGLLDPPDLARAAAGKPLFKNAANTSLAWHAGKLLAQWEAGEPHHVRVPGLETVGAYTFGGKLTHAWSAHPKIDPETGEMIGYGYATRPPYCRFSVVNPKGELVRTADVDLKHPTMMHDFAITANYAVFPEQPQTFDMARALRKQSPWHFDPKLPIRFGLVPRTGTDKPRWFEAETGYFFHTLNAYEDDGAVLVYACRYPRFPDALAFGPGGADKTPNRPVLYRWRLDLKTGAVKEGAIDDADSEFPRVNDARLGRKTRYGYAAEVDGVTVRAFRKFDLEKGTAVRHALGAGRSGGEGVFVPRPGATAEDDGWLVAFVHDAAANRGELLVLDARDFGAKPVARVPLGVRVPYGFHGTWIPGADLK
jgi:carotenoid cleavage dioxygenase